MFNLLTRFKTLKLRRNLNARRSLTSPPQNATSKTPQDSLVQLRLPFSSESSLREQYLSSTGNIRLGLILEEMDFLAGTIAIKHFCGLTLRNPPIHYLQNPVLHPETVEGKELPVGITVVTASVDKIDIHQHKLDPNKDFLLVGNVVHVGTSSMEIIIDVLAEEKSAKLPLLTAEFTMVTRDVLNSKSIQVPPLMALTEAEKLREEQGKFRKQQRKARAERDLMYTVPNLEERNHIHELIYTNRQSRELRDSHDLNQICRDVSTHNSELYVPMQSTIKQSVFLMHPQSRNMYGKIFGGYLMRLAYEQAYTSVQLFTGQQPTPLSIYEQTFHKPVDVGSICTLTSMITYTTKDTVQVEIRTVVENTKAGTRHTTNTVYCTFKVASEPPKILPQLYDHVIKYIESRRRQQAVENNHH